MYQNFYGSMSAQMPSLKLGLNCVLNEKQIKNQDEVSQNEFEKNPVPRQRLSLMGIPLRVEKNHELKSSTLVQTTKSFKNSFYRNKIAFTFITFLYYWKNSFQMKISEINQWVNANFYTNIKEG